MHLRRAGFLLAAAVGTVRSVALPPLLAAQGDTLMLAPVVVTATRVPLAADAVAAAVTVLSGAELRARGIRTVGDALRLVPGATVTETGSYGGQTALFLRGGETDYVKVLLDGVPLNQPGGAIDLADLTTDNVERIEVVRGPGSVLYGSDAVTGVIQIFTRTGTGAPTVRADARGGTYGTTEAAVELAGGGARAGYAVRAARFASTGLHPYNNEYENTTASARVRADLGWGTTAGATYRWNDAVYHFPTDGAGRPADSNQWSGERGPVASLEVTRRLGEMAELRVQGTWQEMRIRFSDAADSPDDDGAFTSRDLVRRAGAGAALHWRPRPGVVLSSGVDYEDQRQRGRSEFAASYGSFPDSIRAHRWNVGYYAQALLGGAERLAVTLGVRLDRNAQFGPYGTARVGGSLRLDPRTRARASAGTGFKEPTFFENFATGFVQGNRDLKPERSVSWEMGLEHAFPGDRITVSVTYFDQRFSDLIEYSPSAAPNYFNVVGARVGGVEARLSAALARGVTASMSYGYLDTRVLEGGVDGGPDGLFLAGRPLIRRPGHTFAPEVWASLGGRGHVTVTGRWVGARDDLDFSRDVDSRRVRLRPYARFSIAAEYQVTRGGPTGAAFVLTARIDNVTGDDAQEIAGFRPRGRSVLVGGRLVLGR